VDPEDAAACNKGTVMAPLPTVPIIIFELLVCILLEDTLVFWGHR
jgi:hypothetical protein